MSILHQLYVKCNVCDETILGDEAELGEPKKRIARDRAREAGWFCINRGKQGQKDFCPEHNPTRKGWE